MSSLHSVADHQMCFCCDSPQHFDLGAYPTAKHADYVALQTIVTLSLTVQAAYRYCGNSIGNGCKRTCLYVKIKRLIAGGPENLDLVVY